MATRTALLNGNVINRDTDFSKHIEAVSEPGVISGFAVSSSSVATGQALVKCERTNGDIIYALVYNNSVQEISGDGDVYIEIPQEIIDNGELANEDGSEIAEIKVGTMPNKNALKLAIKNGSSITDARSIIKKSGELFALINQNIADIEDLDERVEALEEADAINHLEKSGIIGENYTLSNNLFEQQTPILANSTIDVGIGNIDSNKQIHIQRIGTGVGSNQLKLKLKKVGSPTTSLIVEVRIGTKVTISDTEAYWYGGGDLIASGSVPYSSISSSYEEKTITLNGNFGGEKGQLLDIVLYQTDNIVNENNYYVIGCDSTQYSEGFSFVAVNGTTRERSKRMPYCVSVGFMSRLFSKIKTSDYTRTITHKDSNSSGDISVSYTVPETNTYNLVYKLYAYGQYSYGMAILKNGTSIANSQSNNPQRWCELSFNGVLEAGDVITVQHGDVTIGLAEFTASYTRIEAPKPIVKEILYPREIDSIGETSFATLYGTHTNNTFKGGVMLEKTTTATTGNVTLGNAKGYITVNLNGELVKIPYYGN